MSYLLFGGDDSTPMEAGEISRAASILSGKQKWRLKAPDYRILGGTSWMQMHWWPWPPSSKDGRIGVWNDAPRI